MTYGFSYDATSHEEIQTIDAGSGLTTVTYDAVRGFKMHMVDPHMGSWTYAYDNMGNLITQTDANGNVTEMYYDALGRLVRRSTLKNGDTEADISEWQYYDNDSDPNAEIGSLRLETGPHNRTAYYYDDLGRNYMSLTHVIDSYGGFNHDRYYYTYQTWDSLNRPDTAWYYWRPRHLEGSASHHTWESIGFTNTYQATGDRGFVTQVTDSTGEVIMSASAAHVDAQGRLTQQTLGNNVIDMTTEYDPLTGMITELKADRRNAPPEEATTVHHHEYQWDALGNMDWRKDVKRNLTERPLPTMACTASRAVRWAQIQPRQ